MKFQNPLLILIGALSSACAAAAATQAKAPPSYEEARQASWALASVLVETLEKGDAKEWPGTHAWLQDLREQTKHCCTLVMAQFIPKKNVLTERDCFSVYYTPCQEVLPHPVTSSP